MKTRLVPIILLFLAAFVISACSSGRQEAQPADTPTPAAMADEMESEDDMVATPEEMADDMAATPEVMADDMDSDEAMDEDMAEEMKTEENMDGAMKEGDEMMMGRLTLDLTGLEDLGEGWAYEGWLIFDGAPVSSGVFIVDADMMSSATHFDIDDETLAAATAFVLTIEPSPDTDPAPSAVHILGGDFDDDSAPLSVAHAAALGHDFTDIASTYILGIPTSDSDGDSYTSGIWFNGLNLPELPAGWVYEGWVVGPAGPMSTGRFSDSKAVDSDGAGPTAGPKPGPKFAGQDYLNPAIDLTSGYAAVISIEPEPDNSPAPFALKPLVDEDIEDVGDHVPQDFATNTAGFPMGVASRGGDGMGMDDRMGEATEFVVRIENISADATLTSPLAPGLWAVHGEPAPLFIAGESDRGEGLEALAEDGNPADLAAMLPTGMRASASGVFNTPTDADEPGPLLPGQSYEFRFSTDPQHGYLSFATMFVQSNDWFYAPAEMGIALFADDGSPFSGDVSDQILLWDAGTEADETPGSGPNQAPRQSGPNTGPADSNPTVRQIVGDFADASAYVKVTITPVQ